MKVEHGEEGCGWVDESGYWCTYNMCRNVSFIPLHSVGVKLLQTHESSRVDKVTKYKQTKLNWFTLAIDKKRYIYKSIERQYFSSLLIYATIQCCRHEKRKRDSSCGSNTLFIIFSFFCFFCVFVIFWCCHWNFFKNLDGINEASIFQRIGQENCYLQRRFFMYLLYVNEYIEGKGGGVGGEWLKGWGVGDVRG